MGRSITDRSRPATTTTAAHQRPARSFNRSPRAFSLIELVMVVLIISVLAGVAVPRYARAQARFRADAAAARLATDLARLAAEARAASAPRQVLFDAGSKAYRAPTSTRPGTAIVGYSVVLADNPYRATSLAASFSGAAEVTFSPFGVPTAAGSIVIKCGDEIRVVSITADGSVNTRVGTAVDLITPPTTGTTGTTTTTTAAPGLEL
jgi:prepilin-type N-terminal cleavage/methylation domain-containing protein